MPRASRPRAVVLVLLCLVLATSASGLADGLPIPVEGTFSSADPVVTSGDLVLSSSPPSSLSSPEVPSALALPGLAPSNGFALRADEIVVDVAWKRGVEAGPRDAPADLRHVEERGRRSLTFTNATVHLDDLRDPAQLLAFNQTGAYALEMRAAGPGDLKAVPGRVLAAAGSSPENARTEGVEHVGFWYRADADWAGATVTNANASATGDFGLFLNNLTLTVEGEEGTWTNWTGYRDEGSTDVARSYEERIVVLDLTGAQLTVASDQRLALYGPSLTGTIDGMLKTPRAWGSLATTDGVVALDAHRLSLSGTGSISLGVADDRPMGVPALRVAPAGEFTLATSAPRLPVGDEGAGFGLGAPISGLWALLGVVLVTTSAALGGLPIYRALSEANERRRERRFEAVIADGRDLEAGDMFHAAAVRYREAVDLAPERPYPRYLRARALIGAQDYAGALAELDEAAQALVVQPLDMLELRVAAAWYAGRREQAADALAQLHEASAVMAVGLAEDLGIPELARGLSGRGQRNGDGAARTLPGKWEGLDGYA